MGRLFQEQQQAIDLFQESEEEKKRRRELEVLQQRSQEEAQSRSLWHRAGGFVRDVGRGFEQAAVSAVTHPVRTAETLGKGLISPAAALTIFPEAQIRSIKALEETTKSLMKGEGINRAVEKGATSFASDKWIAEKFFGTEVGTTGAKWWQVPYKDPAARQIIGQAMTAPLLFAGGGEAITGGREAVATTRLARAAQAAKTGTVVGAKYGVPFGAEQAYEQGDIRKLPQDIIQNVAAGALLGGVTGGISGLLRRPTGLPATTEEAIAAAPAERKLPAPPAKALPPVEPTKEELTAALEPTYMTPEKMMRQDDIKLAQTRMKEIVNEEAQAMRQREEQAAVGLQPTAEGGYIRTSEHSPEYRQYYAEKGRKPGNAFYKDLAQKNLGSGKGQFQEEYNIVRDVANQPEVGVLPPTPAEAIPTKVPGTILPVGEGATKTSRLAQRITSRLEGLDQQTKDALPTYNVMNKQDQIAAAADYVTRNPDEAMAVLKGDVAPPQGLLRNSIALALEEKATQDGDAEMARNLASLYSTRAGQEISILTERDPNSPVRYIADVQKARIEARGGQEAVTRSTTEETAKIQSEIARTTPNKQSWSDFIDSLRCGG